MRDTEYARELATAKIEYPDGHEAQIERLFVKGIQQEEIRFSWWKDGRMIPRPLDLPEDDLLELMKRAMDTDALSRNFVNNLRRLITK
jgi:hypothetical protein